MKKSILIVVIQFLVIGLLSAQGNLVIQTGNKGYYIDHKVTAKENFYSIGLTAAIAETNRVPFDLPEAETELVAGFHTEYSAMKFALFFWLNTSTCSRFRCSQPRCFSVVGTFPLWKYFWSRHILVWPRERDRDSVNIVFFLFLYIWLRGTLPRFRFDQLMNFGWKVLLPLALLNIFLTATLIFLFPNL